MNKAFSNDRNFISNSGIYEAYFTEVKTGIHFTDFLDRCARILSLPIAARIAKAVTVSAALLGMIGVIGAMESEASSLPFGILLASALLGVEYLCLRRKK